MTGKEIEEKLKKEYEKVLVTCPDCSKQLVMKISSPIGFGNTTYMIKYSCLSCTQYPFVKPVYVIRRTM